MKIKFSTKFDKLHDKAPEPVQEAFQNRLLIFLTNPYSPILYNHKLKGKWLGHRSINVTGDWRAIYHEMGEDTIAFDSIGTHSQLYR